MKGIKKGIAVLICAAMVLGMTSAELAAKVNKLKLTPKRITISEGETVTIKIKKANKKTKVKWKSNKESIVTIIKKKTKGKNASAKILGVKKGKAQITAIYKEGKKNKKLKCQVTVTSFKSAGDTIVTDMPLETAISYAPEISQIPEMPNGPEATKPVALSSEKPEETSTSEPVSSEKPEATPTSEPAASRKPETTPTFTPAASRKPETTPTKEPVASERPIQTPTIAPTSAPGVEIVPDLSGMRSLYNIGQVNVNSDGSITGVQVQGLLIPLGTNVYPGETVKITVYGEGTASMRSWLSDGNSKRWSEIKNPMVFGQEYELVSDDSISNESLGSGSSYADYFQIKGASYNSVFDNITITKVVIEKQNTGPVPSSGPAPTAEPGWVTTWGTAEEKCDITADAMPKMALNGSTVRQIIKVTTSGERIRLRLSNQYGGSDVQIQSLHIAKQVKADESTIDTSTDVKVTVGGQESFVIPRGKVITTDAVSFNVAALENIAISAYFGSAPTNNITGHRGARATTYQVSGNHVSDNTLTSSRTTTSWFFLADVSLWSPAGGRAVVCFGDSITDGYGTDAGYLGRKPDSYTRWGDYFAKRLQSNEKTKNVAVINEGIGSNSMLGSYPTDAGRDRFRRDLLEHDGVAYCIILFGVNDLDKLYNTDKYNQLLPEYQKIVKLCHDNGIKVYGAPILPFGTSSYYSEASEQVRTMINNWMRSSDSQMDGIIDFESAVADPANPKNILEKYTHSDGLHPYDGYDVMADAIDLTLFE